MSNSISIPSSHLKYLIPGYRVRLEEIDKAIAILEGEKKEIRRILSTVDQENILINQPNNQVVAIKSAEYDNTMSWFAKAKFVLKKAGKPLTTSQIVDEIMSYEPGLDNRLLAVRNISSILGVKSTEGKEIERFKIDGKDQKFGLK